MSSALSSALSGMRVHQTYLDIVGNNIANVSTPGFRSSRITFSDVMSQFLRTGSGPTSTFGGVNPMQVGQGVQVHSIDIQTRQGVLNDTGRPFDLGIEGDGFFVLNAGTRNAYSRAGIFGIDRDNFLVDTGSGYRVRSASGADIQLPLDTLLPANPTSQIDLGGNLPAKVGGPLAEVLNTTSAFSTGTRPVVSGTVVGPYTFADGDTLDIRVDGAAAQTVTFLASDFAAIGANIASASATEVATIMQQQLTGVTVSGASGSVVITDSRTGDDASIQIDDGVGSPAALLGLSTTLVSGVSSPASAVTLLNDLADNLVDYVNGDEIELAGTDAAGGSIAGTFVYGTDGTTLGELVTFINGILPDATASLDISGNIVVTADVVGEANLAIFLTDGAGNTGATQFTAHGFVITTDGTGPDEVRTSVDIFDTRGLRHTLTLNFTRINDSEWDVAVTTDNANDVVIDGIVQGVRFNADGSFSFVTGTGAGSNQLEILFDGLTAAQSIDLDLGTSGQLDGVTQLGDTPSLRAISQDGFAVGELVSIAVNSDGTINGSFSNGQQQILDQIGLAVFSNPEGLERRGQTFFEESANSGIAQLLTAGTGRAGAVFGGALESSNVDVASEFVMLIEAQRGFQANARVIKVADELLNELVNIV